MPQWLRAGHCLLQASGPFLTSNFKTPLTMLNLRQSKLLCWLTRATAVSPWHQSTQPPPSPLSGFTYHSERRGKNQSQLVFPVNNSSSTEDWAATLVQFSDHGRKEILSRNNLNESTCPQKVVTEKQSVWLAQGRQEQHECSTPWTTKQTRYCHKLFCCCFRFVWALKIKSLKKKYDKFH